MKRLFKVSTMSSFAAVAFVINPLWVTSCDQKKSVNFTRAEMLSELAEAARTHTMETEDGVFTLDLKIDGLDAAGASKSASRAPSFVQTAAACGHYEEEFVVGASACADTFETSMVFKGAVTVTWAPTEGEPVTFTSPLESAAYKVFGSRLTVGQIRFETSLDGGPKLDVALFTSDGDGQNFQIKKFGLSTPDVTVEKGDEVGLDMPRW